MARATGRILFALTGAAIGAVAVALVEARPASSDAHAPGFVTLALADLGVLAPLAMGIGAGVAVVALYLGMEMLSHLDGDRAPALSLFDQAARFATLFGKETTP